MLLQEPGVQPFYDTCRPTSLHGPAPGGAQFLSASKEGGPKFSRLSNHLGGCHASGPCRQSLTLGDGSLQYLYANGHAGNQS